MSTVNGCRWSGAFVRLFLLVWAALGSPQPATAQPVDSLTARLIKSAESARHLFYADHSQEAFVLLRTLLRSPDHQRSPLGSIHLYYCLGMGGRKVGNLEEAVYAFKQANQLALQLRDTAQLIRVGYGLSGAYTDQGDRLAAIAQCHRTLAYAIHDSSNDHVISIFSLLSDLYRDLGNQTLANEYSDRYVQMGRRSEDFVSRMYAEWFAANRLEVKGQYQQAIAHMNQVLTSLRAARIDDKNQYLTTLLMEMAHVHRKHRQWQPALKALTEALHWSSPYQFSILYLEMAAVQGMQGKTKQAVQTARRAVRYARQVQRPQIILDALEVLQQVQAQDGQYRLAWLTAATARQLADSLSSLTKTKAIAQVETRYKVAAKEIIILDLQKDKAIRVLQATAHQQELVTVRQQQVLLLGLVSTLTVFVGIVSYLLNRTRRLQKQTEQQRQLLETQTDELQLVNANKDKLFSIVSHDLRAPVYNLQHLLQNVQQTPIQSATWPSLVAQLTERVDQLSRLINNLLYWSLAQQGQLRDRPEQVSIRDILTSCQTLLMETIHHKALQIEIQGPEVYLWTDDAQMRLIIRNLLDNAIKFSPVAGSVTIHWTSEPTGVYLEVTNQIASATSSGANLGLRIVTELLERQGGSVTIDQSQVSRWRVGMHWPARLVMLSDNVVELFTGF